MPLTVSSLPLNHTPVSSRFHVSLQQDISSFRLVFLGRFHRWPWWQISQGHWRNHQRSNKTTGMLPIKKKTRPKCRFLLCMATSPVPYSYSLGRKYLYSWNRLLPWVVHNERMPNTIAVYNLTIFKVVLATPMSLSAGPNQTRVTAPG